MKSANSFIRLSFAAGNYSYLIRLEKFYGNYVITVHLWTYILKRKIIGINYLRSLSNKISTFVNLKELSIKSRFVVDKTF